MSGIFGLPYWCLHCGHKGTISKDTRPSMVERFTSVDRAMIYLPCESCGREVARAVSIGGHPLYTQNVRIQHLKALIGQMKRVRIVEGDNVAQQKEKNEVETV